MLIKIMCFFFLYSAAFKFRYVLFFALMTPLGIAIGTIITEIVHEPNAQTENTLVAVLQTLASGTLLYVAFFEVSSIILFIQPFYHSREK